jgi:hypothetical protein
LDAAYVDNARQVVRMQLSRAGVRLAAVLERTLGAAGPSPSPSPSPAPAPAPSPTPAPSPAPSPTPAPSPSPSPSPHELLANPGFESGSPAPWTATRGVISDDPSEPAHSGQWVAWLDGYGRTTTDRLQQAVTLPAGSAATLSFWLHIDTDETSRTHAYDTLTVQLLDDAGHVLKTLATYSNVDAADGWRQVRFDIGAYAGRPVTLRFTGHEDNSKVTSFVIDDVSVTAE